jgi:hypothetical protein
VQGLVTGAVPRRRPVTAHGPAVGERDAEGSKEPASDTGLWQAVRGQGGGSQAAATSPRPRADSEARERSRRRGMACLAGVRGRCRASQCAAGNKHHAEQRRERPAQATRNLHRRRSHPLCDGSCATPQRSFSEIRPLCNWGCPPSLRLAAPILSTHSGLTCERCELTAARRLCSAPERLLLRGSRVSDVSGSSGTSLTH